MAAAFKLLFVCTFFCIVELNHIKYYTAEGKDEVTISDHVKTNPGNKVFHSISSNTANKQNFNQNNTGSGAVLTESETKTSGKHVIRIDRKETLKQNMMNKSWQNVVTSTNNVVKSSTPKMFKFPVRNIVHSENMVSTSSPNIEETLNRNVIETSTANMVTVSGQTLKETSTNVACSESVVNISNQNEIRTSTESPVIFYIENVTQISSQKVTRISDYSETETLTKNISLSQNVTHISPQNKIGTSTENAVTFFVEDVTTTSQNITEIPASTETETITGNFLTFPHENVTKISYNVTRKPIYLPVTSTPHGSEIINYCDTPNYDKGLCIEIKKCHVLVKQINNNETWPFIRASRCDESDTNFNNSTHKVCCGKYDHFRNVSKDIVEGDVFPKSCSYQKELFRPRILGGTEASLGEYPWMALLIQKNQNRENVVGCAGFLIHTKYVITAAHCTHPKIVKQSGTIFSVLLGEHNIQTTTDCVGKVCVNSIQNLRITKVITHPDFNPSDTAYHNDIAIIKLRSEAVLTDYVQPICLVENDNQTSTKYYISGWGNTEKGTRSNVKMKLEIPHFNKTQCIEKYSGVNIAIRDTQICAGGEYQKDTCSGDSGGPLMVSKDNDIWYATGIVSFGMGCGEKGWPGVYTSIGKFLPWIKSQMTQT